MNNSDWLFLKTLAEEQNITKAAKRLFVSQPSMTEKIKKLEQEFGASLLIRKPRGIEFTPEGKVLVDYARRALLAYDATRDQIMGMKKKGLQGNLRVACSNVFARYYLMELITAFHKLYPNVDISFKSGFSSNLYQDFLRGEVHFVICRGTRIWGQIKHMILREPLSLFSATAITMAQLENALMYNTRLTQLCSRFWMTGGSAGLRKGPILQPRLIIWMPV